MWVMIKKEYDERFSSVLKEIRKDSVKLNKNKCKISVKEINYLVHRISEYGIIIDVNTAKNGDIVIYFGKCIINT